jgi:hypothetical protein
LVSSRIAGGAARNGVSRGCPSQPPLARAVDALVESLGFEREGYSPRYLKIAGRWRDHERWAI